MSLEFFAWQILYDQHYEYLSHTYLDKRISVIKSIMDLLYTNYVGHIVFLMTFYKLNYLSECQCGMHRIILICPGIISVYYVITLSWCP